MTRLWPEGEAVEAWGGADVPEGLVNLVVRPDVYERYREALRSAPLLWVEGQVQREGQVLSVLVYRVAALVPRRRGSWNGDDLRARFLGADTG